MAPKKALVPNRCARLGLIARVVPGRSHAKDEESKTLWKLGFSVTNTGFNSDQGFDPLWKAWTARTAEIGGSTRFDYLFYGTSKIIVG